MSAVALCLAIAIFLSACNRGRGRVLEIAYVSGIQVNLRDHVAAVYEKAGVVKNGERVEVLDHDRRFSKVRTASGAMGWMEQRYLVGQDVYDQIQKLTADNQNDPVQAQGVDAQRHQSARRTGTRYRTSLSDIFRRKAGAAEARHSREARSGCAPVALLPRRHERSARPQQATRAPSIEDWWLVRDSHSRVGWVLARMIDVDVPLDVAQYAEGQRIVAFFVLDQVQDGDKKVPQYLTVLTEPKDGLPFDFNQIRVFTWNVRHHRYETAYRERMEGVLPVTVTQENFDKEGMLPGVHGSGEDDSGSVSERKYKLNTPMVRRVLAPGEEPVRRKR